MSNELNAPLVQSLESRRLLAFATLNPSTGRVSLVGTAGDDVITVQLNAQTGQLDMTLNGQTESFARTDIRLIAVDAGDGNDTVSIACKIQSHVDGGNGNDSILAATGNDFLTGGAGNDTLDGGGGDDVLNAGDGSENQAAADQLLGRGGDDTLDADGGTDILDGGSGTDTADFGHISDPLTLSLDGVANDGIVGANPSSNLIAIENIVGGQGNDSIVGNSDNNSLRGNNGVDTILGQGGDDTISAGETASIDGGSGDDTIFSATGTVSGESGNDKIFAIPASGTGGLIDAGSGNDQLLVQGNGFTVLGQSGDDQISYENDPDDPTTATGDVAGGSGHDQLTLQLSVVSGNGDIGYQITFDNQANDSVRGAAGGTMNFHSDIESIIGSDGADSLDATGRPNGTSIAGGAGDDTLTGGSFADTLDGQDGNDSVDGGAGEDVVRGSNGNDTLTGGPGSDSFNGGPGNDTMNAADGTADTVNGAQGLGDSATVDNGTDTVIRVETVH